MTRQKSVSSKVQHSITNWFPLMSGTRPSHRSHLSRNGTPFSQVTGTPWHRPNPLQVRRLEARNSENRQCPEAPMT